VPRKLGGRILGEVRAQKCSREAGPFAGEQEPSPRPFSAHPPQPLRTPCSISSPSLPPFRTTSTALAFPSQHQLSLLAPSLTQSFDHLVTPMNHTHKLRKAPGRGVRHLQAEVHQITPLKHIHKLRKAPSPGVCHLQAEVHQVTLLNHTHKIRKAPSPGVRHLQAEVHQVTPMNHT